MSFFFDISLQQKNNFISEKMKKLIIPVLLMFLLAGCHNYKNDAIQLQVAIDSIANEAAVKDSSILEFLNDFNEIQANLDSIKIQEKLVTVQTNRGRELNVKQKKQILEDITLLNQLIQKNKELTASLQKKLNNTSFKIGQLEGVVSEFKLMVDNLEKQVQEKDGEITMLNNDVKKLNINIGSLNQQIEKIASESRQKSETIASQTSQLNKAFFAYGTTKELKDNGVIEKTGGVLGLGRTPTVRKDFNRDYFKEIDIRDFYSLPLMVKRAKVVSVHPVGSYHITGQKTSDTLFVDDKAEFWKVSKYLVIITD
jgi:hypothetical protein